MRKLSTEARAAILSALVEGSSIASTCRTHDWTRSQVLRLVAAGKAEHVGYKKRGSAKLKVYRLIEGRGKGKSK